MLGTIFGVLVGLGVLAMAVIAYFVRGMAEHSFHGPGTASSRSGKLVASLLACLERDPAMASAVARWRAEPRIADLLREDADTTGSDHIARAWLARAASLVTNRGLEVRLPGA